MLRSWIALAVTLAGGIAFIDAAQVSPAATLVKVVGNQHKLALFSDGRVVGWRQFRHGQLGPYDRINVPGQFTAGAVTQALPGKAIDVAANEFTSYAVMDDGSVLAWGRGDDGQLGSGLKPNLPLLPSDSPSSEYRGADRPVRVRVGPAVGVAAAGLNAIAALKDGSVSAWGARNGVLGDAFTAAGGQVFVPVTVAGAQDVVAVSLSTTHALAVTRDGRVLAWGSNRFGAIGREPIQENPLTHAAEVPGLSDVIAVAAAQHVSTAVKRDGTVWVWGSNSQGQFGNGIYTSNDAKGNSSTPLQVSGVTNAIAITSGLLGRHTFALLKDGSLRGWGNTDWGQLGAGVAATYQAKPVTPKISGVTAIFAAGNNTFAVKSDGTIWAWGFGSKTDWPFQAHTKVPTLIELK